MRTINFLGPFCFFKKEFALAPASMAVAREVYLCRSGLSIEEREDQTCFGEARFWNICLSQPSKHYPAL
ncbi:MAG TPA: hypothetical protein VIS99_12905, partial [Terrimicrobiaceae bacterium]